MPHDARSLTQKVGASYLNPAAATTLKCKRQSIHIFSVALESD